MTLDEALARIQELEAKLDALEVAPASESAEPAGMKCPECGAMNASDATSCSECGASLAAKTDADDLARLEGERDAARMALDEAKAELETVRKDAEDTVSAKVREALDVLTKAVTVLGKGTKIKLDGKDVELIDAPLRAVKCAVIKAVKGKTISAEKADAYVDALFDDAVDAYNPGAKSAAAAKAVVVDNEQRKDSENASSVDPEKAALEKNKTRISSAWMSKTDDAKN